MLAFFINPQIQDRLHVISQRRHLGLAALGQSEVNKHAGDRDESRKKVRPHLCWTLLCEASLHNNSKRLSLELKRYYTARAFHYPNITATQRRQHAPVTPSLLTAVNSEENTDNDMQRGKC